MSAILGIDVGSVAVSAAVIDSDNTILETAYRFHKGSITQTVTETLTGMDLRSIAGIAVTSATPDIIRNAVRFDTHVAIICAVKHFYKNVGSILYVGGENFGLIRFNENGTYESSRTNSSCAAGTGSFLDQQAKRLKLEGSEALSAIACSNDRELPKIATRCAVFAKTDLIHAQQQGYTLGQISDGLCEGLAKNIVDTLIPDESTLRTPLVLACGVSMNHAVAKHFKELLKIEPEVGEYSPCYGAIGAALLFAEEKNQPGEEAAIDAASCIRETKIEKKYGYPPLSIVLSAYPEFESEKKYTFASSQRSFQVEVDLYRKPETHQNVYIGIDIGSTSTKAVVVDMNNAIIAGFYTTTSGQPLQAVQALFEAIDDLAAAAVCTFHFSGVGTTGSGRKFIGKIINADLIVDEITAHARAAYELDHDVDTIIEIGGQDSKFTTMKNGMVTFSVMNNVCAAGTGSFIEEQANKLGCPVALFSERALNTPAPLSSDRCTVFMERDMNHFLNNGYSVDEVLASVLHSVRENYLSKVAVQASIGDRICFQGATAKNKALVAAFEQKLKKPIFVSKFCHLTGAYGSALILAENKCSHSQFRGIDIYKDEIPVDYEVCSLCNNHCKINKVTIQNDIVASGFLCGRDYNTKKHVDIKDAAFDLVSEHKKIFTLTNTPKEYRSDTTIGIPTALFLSEEGVLWKHFFNTLGIRVITGGTAAEPVKSGRRIAGAEFCAPMSSFYGQVQYLAAKADYLFLPVYLETREKDKANQYCYFSQYASSLVASNRYLHLQNRTIMPVIDSRHFALIASLVAALKPVTKCSYWAVYVAYQGALAFYNERRGHLPNMFRREFERTEDIRVLLLGRPYVILEKTMNKRIPDIFEEFKIRTFSQDMLQYSREEVREIEELTAAFHWNYAVTILEAAVVAAKRKGLYPVYVTSFKCGPDSFAVEYFKRIMDSCRKPYLILQLDEHDSNVGYETRIESAVRSFRNHFRNAGDDTPAENRLPVTPRVEKKLDGKTLLFPCWDPINARLVEAILIRNGIDARMVPLTENAIRVGPRTNTGMCLPVNIIIQDYIDYIESHSLDPEQTTVWMFESNLACNIKMFPYFIKSVFESCGKGMEKVSVYLGDLTFRDISYRTCVDMYFAHMFGGMLRKIGCSIRPYETQPGMTDRIVAQSLDIFYNTFLGNRNKDDDVKKVVNLFKGIGTVRTGRPKVAVFGDIYVRDNDVMNQHLIHCIEAYGGEVITLPFNEIVKAAANPFIERSMMSGMYLGAFSAKAILTVIGSLEKNYYAYFNEILHETPFEGDIDCRTIFDQFNIKVEQTGESADNLTNISVLKKHYPDIRLFIATNPAFCCAGLVTEAMNARIEQFIGTPVVSLNYDGTNSRQNEKIIPYLKYAR